MNILVTGATGFVGQSLLSELSVRGHKVTPIVRRISTLPGEVIINDINSGTVWYEALKGCNVVVHLAARVHLMQDATYSMREFRRVNVEGSLNLAWQAAEAGVKRFVFLSSVKVNGESTEKGRIFTSDDVPAPEDAYSVSKTEAEQGLRSIATRTGMEVVIIRPPLVYGPGVKANFAAMLRMVVSGIPLPLGAITHNSRSLLALDNLVDLIALCSDPNLSPRAANEVFLVSDCEVVSTTELLRKVAHAYGLKIRLLPLPVRLISALAKILGQGASADRLLGSLVVDNSKVRNLLGWKPVISMDEQLKKMALHDSHM